MPLSAKDSTSAHRWWCRRCSLGEVQTSNSSLERTSVLEQSLVDVFNTRGSTQILGQGSWEDYFHTGSAMKESRCWPSPLLEQEHQGELLAFQNKCISFCAATLCQ